MISERQKRTIQAIVNVFETGKAGGDYAKITLLSGDPGHLTYGRSQTTLASGNLWRLVQNYCEATNAATAEGLRAYLPRLEAGDTRLDADSRFRALLREAGSDDVMRRVQDEFFDRVYWEPALRAGQGMGIETALGTGVVYDSFIHGAWRRLRDLTTKRVGLPSASRSAGTGPGEREWVRQYITVRREWLAGHRNPLLRRTVYRMDTFGALVEAGNWDLELPIETHGVLIDESAIRESRATEMEEASVAGAGENQNKNSD